MWLFRGSQAEESYVRKREAAPNNLVMDGNLKDVSIADQVNVFEFLPDGEDPELQKVYRTDLPFVTKGIVDTFGVILPYFEFSMSLGTHLTRCWVGFEEVGGAELKIAEGKARVRPAKIAYDVFSEFELGETIGIGIHPRTAKLYITKNGEMLKSEVTQLRDHMGEKEFPTIRLSGGPCKFTLNLGAGEDPFLFSPYSYK